MRWIVDGMNVIGSRPDGWWSDRPAARRRLVAEVARLWEDPATSAVEVVFDGSAAPDEAYDAARVGVSFAGRGANAADRVIADEVARASPPAGVTVVTSDNALAAAVRAGGARVTSVGSFRRHLAQLGTAGTEGTAGAGGTAGTEGTAGGGGTAGTAPGERGP